MLKALCNTQEDNILTILNNNRKNLKGLHAEMFYIMQLDLKSFVHYDSNIQTLFCCRHPYYIDMKSVVVFWGFFAAKQNIMNKIT